MPEQSSTPTHHRARVAVAMRYGNHEAAAAARRDLREAVAAKRIREIVDAAPPLTAEQRSRLAALLSAPPAPEADAA